MESFSVIFLSILLEALPFVMIGTIVSSLIEVFVTPEWLQSHLPKKRGVSYLVAGMAGFLFPVCECAIVPIMRKLLKKGMPLGVAVTFMLATPTINPVVLLSTHYAFPNTWMFPILRGIFGYLSAVLIGVIMSKIAKSEDVLLQENPNVSCSCNHHHESKQQALSPILQYGQPLSHTHRHEEYQEGLIFECSHTNETMCACGHNHLRHEKNVKGIFVDVIAHTSIELYEVGRFLIIGACLSAAMQVFVPREYLFLLGTNRVLAILSMMLLAFVLSLCSEADAFIAATFQKQFLDSALVGFLIFGPMMDIKNMLMLSTVFKPKLLAKFMLTIAVVCFVMAWVSGL